MGQSQEHDRGGRCSACGSSAVICSDEYYTTGGDMEHVQWSHTCQQCGHVDTEFTQGCYGYDNEYWCPMCGRKH